MREVATKKNEKQVVAEPVVHDIPVQEETVVTWDGPDDPNNPQNFSFGRKCSITFVICLLTICTTFASSAPAIASQRLIEQFGITEEVSDLVTTLFLLGYVTGPIFWGSGSEIFGRQLVLLLSMTVYTILFIGQALATNIETVLILRFLSGTFGVAPLIVSGGLLADIWNSRGRGYAVNLFAGCVFLGPSFGPVVVSWIYWVLMIFAAACTLAGWLLLPETYAPVLLARKARRLRAADPIGNANLVAAHDKLDKSLRGIATRTIFHPWKMMAKEPILILLTAYMALLYGVLYALLEAFPVIFLVHRGFTVTQTGLIFIGIGVGGILTTLINLYFAYEFNKIVPKWKGFPPAEVRLPPAMIGSVILVLSALWLGWSGFYLSVPWYVASLSFATSTVFVGMSLSLIFIAFLVYIVDTYLMLSASALASSTMVRSVVGAAFPLFTTQMYENLGIQWASTLIACISLLMAPIPFLFYKYGAKIRERSQFAPCFDLKIAKELAAEEAEARDSGSSGDVKSQKVRGEFHCLFRHAG
ncbi:major facilitator superfamily domain-containing protein [Rhodocollybia butyracea]|uniref:Major facilitator superfamily domain-containing protein n=1 Tax=Rhodocollybia butyracea TaxID=206335 RepID=A0A9P5Q8V2_9AGAR|nr:major facilitator superfamily domain-containing protein [Rhodocollybia butyracea]